MKTIFLILAVFFLSSCTHWLVDTNTRIRVENGTGVEVYNLSVVSPKGQIDVLVPDTVKAGGHSKTYENEWVGKFKFAIFAKNSPIIVDLGEHKLEGGSVSAQIKEENGAFTMILK